MRIIATYLIYAAAVVRTVEEFDTNPPVRGTVVVLLALYGLALACEPLLTRRMRRYPFYYLALQSGLVLSLLIVAPTMDFLPMLFFPLSFQAVEFFGRRLGFLWIGGFTLAMAVPLLVGWDWELPGLASGLLFAGFSFMMGSSADQIERAGLARQENQRLLAEMGKAYRQLQEYAAQVEEYAGAQERGRLARELHDSVTQTLFSMNLAVQAAQMLAAREPERVSEQLDRLQELAHAAAGEIQVLARQIQPRSPAGESLVEALTRLAEERRKRDGLQVRLEVTGPAQDKILSQPENAGLYRIAQEALNNVAKHAGTCEAVVRLDLASQPASLEIEDHGAGFDPETISRSLDHIGLPGMAERAREMGWKIRVESQPGQGTRIRVEEQKDGG